MSLWIGLTGGIGSGKSQAAACFAAWGVPVIDADRISRELTDTPGSAALQAVRAHFGDAALLDSGSLNRAYMRSLIFADPSARADLEALLHPLIFAQIQAQQAAHSDAPYGIVELPTLLEHPVFRPLVKRVLVIHSNQTERIERVHRRSGLDEAQIRAIMAAQVDDETRLTAADDIIHNNGTLSDLEQAVTRLHLLWLDTLPLQTDLL